MQITQVLSEETRDCPYCGERHNTQEVLVTQTIVNGPMVAQVPARYLYCGREDVFYEDMVCMAWNQQQAGAFVPMSSMGPMGPMGAAPFMGGQVWTEPANAESGEGCACENGEPEKAAT